MFAHVNCGSLFMRLTKKCNSCLLHCLHAKCFSKGTTYSKFNGCTANVLYCIAMHVEKWAVDSCNLCWISSTIIFPQIRLEVHVSYIKKKKLIKNKPHQSLTNTAHAPHSHNTNSLICNSLSVSYVYFYSFLHFFN